MTKKTKKIFFILKQDSVRNLNAKTENKKKKGQLKKKRERILVCSTESQITRLESLIGENVKAISSISAQVAAMAEALEMQSAQP